MASKIQFRRDTSNNWETINPILAAGEIGYIFEKEGQEYKPTNQYKLGDGVKHWLDLPLFGFSGTFSESLDLIEGEDSANVAVSKLVLIDKFKSIEDSIKLLASIKSLEELEEKVKGNTDNIKALQDTVGGNTDNIKALQTTVEENTSDITALQDTVGGNTDNIKALQTTVGENVNKITKLETKVTDLQEQHRVLSKNEWGNGESALDGVFYYIYENKSN